MATDREWDPETVFDVLGNQLARRVLALAAIRPCSAEEVADRTDASLPTVYRRLNVLQEYDLVAERRAIDEDGTHFKTYETTLERVCFEVAEGGFEIDIQLERDLVHGEADFRENGHAIGEPDAG